jgi:hypothetical protein
MTPGTPGTTAPDLAPSQDRAVLRHGNGHLIGPFVLQCIGGIGESQPVMADATCFACQTFPSSTKWGDDESRACGL